MMPRRSIVLITMVLIAGLALPGAAFTADKLALEVQENGDALITFDYTLNWIERIAVFFRIANPEQELKRALERAYNRPAAVSSVTPGSATFSVVGLARVSETDEGTVYRVPALDFTYAVDELERYWFAPLVSVDLAPDLTTVAFPDGYVKTWYDVTGIPEISHTIVR